ncbi:MAG: hypothetical protein QW566_00575 [Candidatus Jordarchaeales archaeon]
MRAADYAALSVCVLTLLFLLPGFRGIPPYASILFYLFIPGYAFIRVFFTQISGFEKLLLLVAFSIALSAFVEVVIRVLVRIDIPGVAVSSFLTMVMLGIVIVRDRPRFERV